MAAGGQVGGVMSYLVPSLGALTLRSNIATLYLLSPSPSPEHDTGLADKAVDLIT